jgi:glycosyltransferase involved in cell wall biosynthesis
VRLLQNSEASVAAESIRHGRRSLTFVVPFFNEAPNLGPLLSELDGYAKAALSRWSILIDAIFVDDGSTDNGSEMLQAAIARSQDGPAIRIIRLSRKFGKEVALAAGLDQVGADAAVMMDADLQHPFSAVDAFIKSWLNDGYEVVYGIAAREEGLLKTGARCLVNMFMNAENAPSIPYAAGDFRLLSRRAYEALRRLGERQRIMKGLYGWIGFRQKAIPFVPLKRHAGTTKFSILRLWMLTLDGITSNTLLPLRLAAVVGLVAAILSGGYGLWTIIEKLVFGISTPGYPTIVVIIGFIGAVQLIFLGVIGEYLGRVLVEVRGRPLYLVEDDFTLRDPSRKAAS